MIAVASGLLEARFGFGSWTIIGANTKQFQVSRIILWQLIKAFPKVSLGCSSKRGQQVDLLALRG